LESGNETEFKKILNGNGDFILYGFAGEDGKMKSWKILNLKVFRETIWDEYRRRKANEPRKVTEQKIRNHDGTGFLAFDVRDFPAGLVVASG
jgi:hypothetical protein